jgi:hypothetical protein
MTMTSSAAAACLAYWQFLASETHELTLLYLTATGVENDILMVSICLHENRQKKQNKNTCSFKKKKNKNTDTEAPHYMKTHSNLDDISKSGASPAEWS